MGPENPRRSGPKKYRMMTPKESAAFRRICKELQRTGVLLASDARLPSVAGLTAEAPMRVSWWAHPEAHAIYHVAVKLSRRRDVVAARLISAKVTFVHQRLWPALLAVAAAREPWQTDGLSSLAKELLRRVARQGSVRTDRLAEITGRREKALGAAARELERRLLVYGESVHTESGAHAKQLESWGHWARRVRFKRGVVRLEEAKKQFEAIAAALEAGHGARARLPWKQRA